MVSPELKWLEIILGFFFLDVQKLKAEFQSGNRKEDWKACVIQMQICILVLYSYVDLWREAIAIYYKKVEKVKPY